MRNILLGLFAAVTLCTGAVRAADSAVPDYQSAVRAALTERGWRITEERAGRITAERSTDLGRNGNRELVVGTFFNNTVRLIVHFGTDDKGQAASSARASLCYYNRFSPSNVDQAVFSPVPYRDPKLTQEYRDIVAEAKSSVTAHHRADPDNVSQNRVAMK